MILVSSCWKKNFIRNNARNFFILSLVFLKLLIVSVAFFLGHPVFTPRGFPPLCSLGNVFMHGWSNSKKRISSMIFWHFQRYVSICHHLTFLKSKLETCWTVWNTPVLSFCLLHCLNVDICPDMKQKCVGLWFCLLPRMHVCFRVSTWPYSVFKVPTGFQRLWMCFKDFYTTRYVYM